MKPPNYDCAIHAFTGPVDGCAVCVVIERDRLVAAGWERREIGCVVMWRMPMLRWVRWFTEKEAARIERVRAGKELAA